MGGTARGKTTLLKLLAGVLPSHRRRHQHLPNTIAGYYEQSNVHLVDTRPCWTRYRTPMPAADRQKARDICGAMLFEGDDALKKVAVLSGGEKSRVVLGKIIAPPTNLLLLDEPTNHLDMESCDALLAALDELSTAP